MVTPRFVLYFCIVVVLTAFGPGFGTGTANAAEKTTPVPNEDVQVLSSGPIHEAFAEIVAFDPESGIVAPKTPPNPINEIPPEKRPDGDVQWIHGYWAWDDERNEYIWVSGIWRTPPPGRLWVSGYWAPVRQGFQWISGYWASAKAAETEYMPEPPESVEAGPSSNAPSSDYTWIPGCWVWNHGRYAWRAGYWSVMYPDWIWVPDHYICAPRGYVFVSGYWDYNVIHRGVLFAPVFFPARARLGLRFPFSPRFAINLNVFEESLFLRIGYGHYFYGDYYGSLHYKRGIYPWVSVHTRRVFYDPIYAHQRWNHRNDHGWENRLQKKIREHGKQDGQPPLRSFNQRSGAGQLARTSALKRPNVVMPLDRADKAKVNVYRFKPTIEKERRESSQQEKGVRTYIKERQNREPQRKPITAAKISKRPATNKDKFSKPPVINRPNEPVINRPNEKVDRKPPPSTQYKTPQPNPKNVEPLQRKYDLSHSWRTSQEREDRGRNTEVMEHRSIDNGRKTVNRGELPEPLIWKSQNQQQRGDGGRHGRNKR